MSHIIKPYGKKGYYGVWTTISDGWIKKGFTYDEIVHEFFDTEILKLKDKMEAMQKYRAEWLKENEKPAAESRQSRKFIGINRFYEAVWEDDFKNSGVKETN